MIEAIVNHLELQGVLYLLIGFLYLQINNLKKDLRTQNDNLKTRIEDVKTDIVGLDERVKHNCDQNHKEHQRLYEYVGKNSENIANLEGKLEIWRDK